MTTDTPAKPAYLGLLNALYIGESRAGVYLKAWADVCSDVELQRAIALVAARESTHGEVFRQRIERLGFSVREKEDPDGPERLRVYGDPAISDAEKIRYGRGETQTEDRPDPLASIEARVDDSMDQLTRVTMAWYIAEERDTVELLKGAYTDALARAGESG